MPSALTAGTTVNASIFIQTSDLTYSRNSGIQAQDKVSAGMASFSVTLPYSWLVAATTDKVMVTVNLSANAFTSASALYYTSYLTRTIALPKNGAATTVNFTGSLKGAGVQIDFRLGGDGMVVLSGLAVSVALLCGTSASGARPGPTAIPGFLDPATGRFAPLSVEPSSPDREVRGIFDVLVDFRFDPDISADAPSFARPRWSSITGWKKTELYT